MNSVDSENYRGRYNLFSAIGGIGNGVWGLRNEFELIEEVETFYPDDEANRKLSRVYRIIRDSALVNELKRRHQDCCQICGMRLEFPDGRFYSEVHHLNRLFDLTMVLIAEVT